MANLSRTEALAWLDQSIDEAHESLGQLSETLLYLGTCWENDDLPGGRVPAETECLLLAQHRKCQLASALIRRLETQVRPQIARLCEPPAVSVVLPEPARV
jgi:hypothetical protein